MTPESRARALLAIGIVLSLVAYLVFVTMDSALGVTCAFVFAGASLGTSFQGLWLWYSHQKARWRSRRLQPEPSDRRMSRGIEER